METQYIGITEMSMKIDTNVSSSKVAPYVLHILFSISEKNYFYAYCLDTGVYTRINLLEMIKKFKSETVELSGFVFQEILKEHMLDTVNYLIECAKNSIAYPFSHVAEEFWLEFRNLRMKRDNYNFAKIFNYTSSEVEEFKNITTHLDEIIKELRNNEMSKKFYPDSTNIYFIKKFDSILNEMKKSAA